MCKWNLDNVLERLHSYASSSSAVTEDRILVLPWKTLWYVWVSLSTILGGKKSIAFFILGWRRSPPISLETSAAYQYIWNKYTNIQTKMNYKKRKTMNTEVGSHSLWKHKMWEMALLWRVSSEHLPWTWEEGTFTVWAMFCSLSEVRRTLRYALDVTKPILLRMGMNDCQLLM